MTSTRPKTCNTERDGGLQKFLYDNDSGNYALIGDASEDEFDGNLRRKLPAPPFLEQEEGHVTAKKPIVPTSLVDGRSLDEQSQIIYGRQCTCARTDDIYCPVGAYLCRIKEPNSWTYRVQCEGDAQGVAARFILPLVIFLYVFFACLLVGSPKGKYAREHCRSFCWKEDRYQYELGQEIDRIAYRAHRQRLRAQRRNTNRVQDNTRDGTPASTSNRRMATAATATMSTVEVGRRVAVGLKTRSYATHAEEVTNECTICLTEFATGDKVGDLTCSHIFHVEPCLKKWIVRRNHCPLCQANNLAAPTALAATSTEQFTTTDEAGTASEEVRSTVEQQNSGGRNGDEPPSVITENEGRSEDDRPGTNSVIAA